MRRLLSLTALAASLALTAGVYLRWLRPLQMHWGATPEEALRPLPGDERVSQPTWNATRAVTVAARPEHIWPLLLQLGWGRAGWYGYDWVDNGGRPSTWEVLPEHQTIEVGKEFPMSPWTAMRCVDFEEGRWMLWTGGAGQGTWLWYLDPLDDGHTRLITRLRDHYEWASPVLLPQQLLTDVGDFPFMRRCLLGVKARAERLAAADA
jgi:hypothetical protein